MKPEKSSRNFKRHHQESSRLRERPSPTQRGIAQHQASRESTEGSEKGLRGRSQTLSKNCQGLQIHRQSTGKSHQAGLRGREEGRPKADGRTEKNPQRFKENGNQKIIATILELVLLTSSNLNTKTSAPSSNHTAAELV